MRHHRHRLSLLVMLAVLAFAVSGCGAQRTRTGQLVNGQLTGHQDADADNDGAYVEAGPITYQLQISRELNPWGVEDSQYVKGLPAGVNAYNLSPDEEWYAVFLWAKNQHHRTYVTPGIKSFEILDTLGDVYRPVPLKFSLNPYAWVSQRLQYGETEPGEDSTAAQGFTGGRELLFKVNTSIYDNRPLTLVILGPRGGKIGEISLDL